MERKQRLREQALEESPVARIVVDADGNLAFANQRARVLFTLNPKDLGCPLRDLEISYRPADLRSIIEQAYAERRTLTQTSVERRLAAGEVQYLDIVVQPLFDETRAPLGAGITFLDVSRYARLQDELRRAREAVQSITEELQSSNEELETTNEELQSTNEELETINEELQAVNKELRQRTEDSNRANAFLEAVLASMRAATVVTNRSLDVLSWNQRAEDLWGLRAEEVRGQSLLNLEIGLPVAELRNLIRPCLAGESDHGEVVLDAVNRRGKPIQCRVSCSPFLDGSSRRDGVILQMEEVSGP